MRDGFRVRKCQGLATLFSRRQYLVGRHGRVDGSGNAQGLDCVSHLQSESILASLLFIVLGHHDIIAIDVLQALLSRMLCRRFGINSTLCDEFRKLFFATTKVKCLSDLGLFLDA
ncbi:hypothetical protein Scep_007475 [Stephania cephalantha]|uniref:Uncharacterized protein n=1 Tax=Stephania cephalantha TaxID=152367 RepID=A0AAP0PL58_9MAGN